MKGTGAKRNVCTGSCVSTGAKFPVAPVESAPMRDTYPKMFFSETSAQKNQGQRSQWKRQWKRMWWHSDVQCWDNRRQWVADINWHIAHRQYAEMIIDIPHNRANCVFKKIQHVLRLIRPKQWIARTRVLKPRSHTVVSEHAYCWHRPHSNCAIGRSSAATSACPRGPRACPVWSIFPPHADAAGLLLWTRGQEI